MSKEKKVCIVIPYFISRNPFRRFMQRIKRRDRFPGWFDLYIESCKYNSTIDWVFFTDARLPQNSSANVKFIKMSLRKFSLLAAEKIGLKINLRYPYKLCDLKPAYGLIGEEYLRHYDFWAWGDIDMIFGDIRKFLTDDLLSEYDVIAISNSPITSGQLCFLRNTNYINALFKESKDWERVFKSSSNEGFDENGERVNNMTEVVNRLAEEKRIKFFYKGYIKADRSLIGDYHFHWYNGKLVEYDNVYISDESRRKTTREIMAFHFVESKRSKEFKMPQFASFDIPNGFVITKTGFSNEPFNKQYE